MIQEKLNDQICVNGVTRRESTLETYRGIGTTDKCDKVVEDNRRAVVKCLDCSRVHLCPFSKDYARN
jgi:hypothetical protein